MHTNDSPYSMIAALPKIELPPLEPPSPEEIARRQAHFKTTLALRERIGPIGIESDQLLHLAEAEDDAVE
jgi:hypothetical protein